MFDPEDEDITFLWKSGDNTCNSTVSCRRRLVCSTSSLWESQMKMYFWSLVNPWFYSVWVLCETMNRSK